MLADWLAEPLPMETFRSDLAVKLRAAAYGERAVLLRRVRETLADHETRLAHYRELEKRDYPVPADLAGSDLDQYLVLRGGIRLEEFWIGWLNEYLEASTHDDLPASPRPDDHRRPDAAQPRRDGLDAHRARGQALGHRQAGGLLRRARAG